MKYEEVRIQIKRLLQARPSGASWQEIKAELSLPYKSLCPEWTLQLETEIGLVRQQGHGKSLVWSLKEKGN